MTIEHASDADATAGTPAGGEPMLQALLGALHGGAGQAVLEAFAQGADGPALVRAFVAQAPLSAEHRSLVEMMLAAQERAASAPEVVDVEPEACRVFDGDDRRELHDLRQLNDTLAQALGACRICWGGDEACDLCGGRGRAGFRPPDLELFEELVAPVLPRVLTMRRAGRHGLARSRR